MGKSISYKFSIDKAVYSPGECIIVNAEVKNDTEYVSNITYLAYPFDNAQFLSNSGELIRSFVEVQRHVFYNTGRRKKVYFIG